MSCQDDDEEKTTSCLHVVIVGAGVAGLMAAHELLLLSHSSSDNNKDKDMMMMIRVTMVEAADYVGGRIRPNTSLVPGHVIDVGAEVIHGSSTTLTDWIDNHVLLLSSEEANYEELFITAHGDGGPSDKPTTPSGKYGMYHVGGELLKYDDDRLKPLHDALEAMIVVGGEETNDNNEDETTAAAGVCLSSSVGDYLKKHVILSQDLYSLAVAGYGNTAGCTDMHQLSLSSLIQFERHWDQTEVEGDFHLHPGGMQRVVDTLLESIQKESNNNNNFDLLLNWQVERIRHHHVVDHDNNNNRVVVQLISTRGDELEGDAVILTIPPPMLVKLNVDDMPVAKIKALDYIGFERAIKMFLKFDCQPWPDHLASIICADGPIPEFWFREFEQRQENRECSNDDDNCNDTSYSKKCHVAVCFLTSKLADDFVNAIQVDESDEQTTTSTTFLDKATNLVIQQLSNVLQVPIDDLVSSHVDSFLYDWGQHATVQGGYMYPRTGLTQKHLQDLANPFGQIFFAGEATHTKACCTVQAAMETGVRAAKQVLEQYYSNS